MLLLSLHTYIGTICISIRFVKYIHTYITLLFLENKCNGFYVCKINTYAMTKIMNRMSSIMTLTISVRVRVLHTQVLKVIKMQRRHSNS